jgi:nucleoside-diphosphate-sugar epimerase
MKILVTGSYGFIGSHIASALAFEGHDIYDLPRDQPFPKTDLIIHCAAAAGPWHTLEDIWRDNIDLTRSLITFANPTYTPIIFLSSITVYGDTYDITVNESTPLSSGTSFYARSKLINELMLQLSAVPHIILRLPGVIGPNANLRNWLPNVARRLLQGDDISIFHADKPFNNAVHVDDLCAFIARLVHEDFDSATFALGAGSCISVENVVRQLATCLNVHNPTIRKAAHFKPHYQIDSNRAQTHGYMPLTMPKMIERFARELLEVRAQTQLDLGDKP